MKTIPVVLARMSSSATTSRTTDEDAKNESKDSHTDSHFLLQDNTSSR